jgi:hypothetical protein
MGTLHGLRVLNFSVLTYEIEFSVQCTIFSVLHVQAGVFASMGRNHFLCDIDVKRKLADNTRGGGRHVRVCEWHGREAQCVGGRVQERPAGWKRCSEQAQPSTSQP